jgi:hypothetical protein
MEEVPLNKVAQCVLKEYARRDILVDEVEIFEYTKKPVVFKEIKGGVAIKGQKFGLDDDFDSEPSAPEPREYSEPKRASSLIVDVTEEDMELVAPTQAAPSLLRSRLLGGSTAPATRRSSSDNSILSQVKAVMRMEVFNPDDPTIVQELVGKGINLTVGKKYPVYEEKMTTIRANLPGAGVSDLVGYNYIIMDDAAKQVEVNSIHFAPEQRGLVGMNTAEVRSQMSQRANGPRLLYMAAEDGLGMPSIRNNFR